MTFLPHFFISLSLFFLLPLCAPHFIHNHSEQYLGNFHCYPVNSFEAYLFLDGVWRKYCCSNRSLYGYKLLNEIDKQVYKFKMYKNKS